jgi:tetratricopeptide (TPR) repeat protein
MADGDPGGFASACVDAATLAAFVDGRIDPAGRARVAAHLASCPDCTELVAEVIRTNDELSEHESADAAPEPAEQRGLPGKVLPMRRRGLAVAGGLVAIAASLVLLMVNRGSELDPLVSIVGNERLTFVRPTGGFRYGPLRSPVRGTTDTGDFRLRAEVARLKARARETSEPGDLHAAGVAELVAGDAAGAIASLQAAERSAPDDARIAADLGAALLARFAERGDQSDAAAALASIDRALARAPALEEAWFNKALLFERTNRPDEAQAAWTKYLEISTDPAWRDEAARNRDALRRQPGR